MTQEYVLALRITGDGKVAVKSMREVKAEAQSMGESVSAASQRMQAAYEKARSPLDSYIASLRRKTETLGMSAAQITVYEAAQLGATKRDLDAVRAMAAQIAAHENARAPLESYIASLRRKTETLGMSAGQLRLHEAAQLGATKRDLDAVRTLNAQIAAHENGRSSLDSYIASLRRKTEMLGMSAAQTRLYEAAQLGATKRDLDAVRAMNAQIAAHEKLQQTQTTTATASATGLGLIGRALAGLATINTVKNIAAHLIEVSDNGLLAQARIALVTKSLAEQRQVSEQLFKIAQQLQLPAREVIDSYPRMARGIREVGGSTQDSIAIVKAHALAVKISGATQAQAAASAMQFAQALGSGRLQGDELRSVMENNGKLAEALARGLGVTTGELRKLGEEGRLTTEKVVQALLRELPKLEEEGKRIPLTVSGAWQQLRNEWEKDIQTSKELAASQALLARFLKGAADASSEQRKAQDLVNEARRRGVDINKEYSRWLEKEIPKRGVATFDQFALQHLPSITPAAPDTGDQVSRRENIEARAEQADLKIASLRKSYQEALNEANTLDSILDKFNKQIGTIAEKYAALVIAGRATGEDTRQYLEAFASLQRQSADAVEKHNNIGKASYASLVERATAALRAQAAVYDQIDTLDRDSTQRRLKNLEYLKEMGIVSERGYIDEVANLRRADAERDLATVRRQIAARQEELRVASKTGAVGANEREAKEKNIANIKKDIGDLMAKEVIANRNLADTDDERVQSQTKLTRATEDRLIAMRRETEDFVRGLDDETEQMKLQLALIGERDVIQQKMLIDQKTAVAIKKEELALTRDIADLKRNGASRAVIDQRLTDASIKVNSLIVNGEAQKKLAEQLIDKQTQDRISQRIAEALVNARSLKDAAKSIGQILQEELKQTTLIVPLKGALQEVVGNITGQLGALFGANAGIIGALGALGGGLGAKALGAGQRGQKVGSIAGLLGGSIFGAIVGKFTDPDGDANRTAIVGSNPGDPGGFRWSSRFGDAGIFKSRWFNAEQHDGLNQFTAMMARIENTLAQRLSPEEIARVSATINRPKEYSFGMEHTDQTDELLGIMKDRLAAVIEATLPGLGHLVTEFQGTGDELMAFSENLLQLRDGVNDVDKLIASVTENAKALIESQLAQLQSQIDTARQKFDTALTTKDAAGMLAAEQELTNAIMDSYRTRVQMARQLQENLSQAEEQSYQFLLNMAGRINSLGGKINVGELAGGRASQLLGRIGGVGAGNIAGQIRDLGAYVSARETEYNARRAEIIAGAEAQLAGQQAIMDAQRSADEARINALQQELALANQFASLVERATGMIDQLRLTAANPLHALGRLELANGDLARLKAAYETATGANRATAANRYAEALQGRISMAQESHQRPSEEYLRYYNDTITELTRVRDDATTEAERAIRIQERIEEIQSRAAGYQQTTADATTLANGQIAALDAEFRNYYIDAQALGEKLYAEQIRIAQENLNAVTGGQELELFVAQEQKRTADAVVEMKDLLRAFLGLASSTGTSTGTGTTVGGSTGVGGGGSGGGGTGPSDTVQPITTPIYLGGREVDSYVISVVDNRIAVTQTKTRREAAFN